MNNANCSDSDNSTEDENHNTTKKNIIKKRQHIKNNIKLNTKANSYGDSDSDSDSNNDDESEYTTTKKQSSLSNDDNESECPSDDDEEVVSLKSMGGNIDSSFFTQKELCYYKMIDRYFYENCTKEQITTMVDIINGNSEISLRILDWFVTKYSKKRLDCGVKKDTEVYDVRISYKAQLKTYKKRYFDPFRRRKKFKYYYFANNTNGSKDLYVNTTLCQLNFFKWALTYDILKYVEKNLTQITKAMNIANKEEKKKKSKKSKDGSSNNSDDGSNDEVDAGTKKKTKDSKSNKQSINKKNIKDVVKINATKTTKKDVVEITLSFD
jgi:hypothetical protein